MLATVDDHLTQWAHNRQFLQSISLKYPDWIVTAALYTALHAVEALLTADGAQPRSTHRERFQILQSKRYEKIYTNYHVLYDLAHVTRYSAIPARWVKEARIKTEVINLLYQIENSVRKLLSERKPPVAMTAYSPVVLSP